MRAAKHPHASEALRHLRNCSFAAMGVLAIALLTQTGVFLLAHFSDAHTATLTIPEPASDAVVTAPSPERAPSPRERSSSASSSAPSRAAGGAAAPSQGPPTGTLVVRGRVINIGTPGSDQEQDAARAQTINTVQTPFGATLRRLSETARTFGILSALALPILMLQSVAVGASARVPGIHHIVSCTTWMILIAGLTVPLHAIAPDIAWPGVFAAYDRILDQSAMLRDGHGHAPSALAFYAQHLLAPVCCLAAIVAVVFRSNAAIEEGIIVTHASQLDDKIEREVRAIGVGHQQMPRAVGALNAAIGDPEPADEPLERTAMGTPRPKPPMPRPI